MMPTRLSQMRWTQFALTPLQMPSVSYSDHRSSNYFFNCSAQPIAGRWLTSAFIHRPGLPAATREGGSLHMCYTSGMLPWVFASDKTNYARYLSVYWCEMIHGHIFMPMPCLRAASLQSSAAQTMNRESNTREASVLTEVQYNAGSSPFTTEPRLAAEWQVSTTLKASSTRMPVCHA